MASIFQKYAVYGLAVKIIPKNFLPSSTAEANIRGIASATMTDCDISGTQPRLNGVSVDMLKNQGDFSYHHQADLIQRYFKVGRYSKGTGGQYWFNCSEYFNNTDNPKLTAPTPAMSRVTCFTWELSGPGIVADDFIGKAEVTYYVAFKQRKFYKRNM